eukprot:2357347-Pyramimonas_sp.AAC.1
MTAAAGHVDDDVVVGEGIGREELLDALGEHFLLKVSPGMARGRAQVRRGRFVWKLTDEMGFSIRVAPGAID